MLETGEGYRLIFFGGDLIVIEEGEGDATRIHELLDRPIFLKISLSK